MRIRRDVLLFLGLGVLLCAVIVFGLRLPSRRASAVPPVAAAPPSDRTAPAAEAAPPVATAPTPAAKRPRVGPRHPPGHPDRVEPTVDKAFDALSPREHVEAGEAAFDAEDAELGYRHFLAVIENTPDDVLAPFALYKLAWAEYNLGDYEAAVDDLELMLTWLEGSEGEMSEMLVAAGRKDIEGFRIEIEDATEVNPGWP